MNPAGCDRDKPSTDSALSTDEATQANGASKQSEHWLRSVVRSTSDIIMVLDADGSARYVNPAAERILGYKAEKLVGVEAFSLVHPEDAERAKQTFSKALRSSGVQTPVEFRLRPADGSWRHVEVVFNNLLDDPSVGGIASTIRDVTECKQADEALIESEGRFRQLFEHSVDALFVIHDETREIVDCNQEACRSLGYSREELLALRLDDFALDLLSEEEKRQRGSNTPWRRALAGEAGTIIGFHENVQRRKDGTTFPVEVGVGSIDYGGRRMILASVRDITERKQTEEELRLSEERLRGLANAALEGLVISDKGIILEANQALLDILGYTRPEVIGESVLEFVASDYFDQVQQNILSNLEEPYEIVGLRKDGTRLDLEVRGKAFSYLGRPVRVTAVRDITQRKALERRLRHQALHDLLTGLPNRSLFLDRLTSALAHARRLRRRVAIMFVDLDNFKFVNDTFGHHAGDKLLVAVSERLRTCLRPEYTLGRLGGDEFAVLLEDLADESEATRAAERILEKLRVPFILDNREVFVTPSIGIAVDDSSQDSPDGLLRAADVAMYWSKKEGKARYQLFEPSIEGQSIERMRLEHDLRRALEHDEFRLYYQPVVRTHNRQIMGAEALVRWEHPERGLVLPCEFVPLAEETGLIVPIGKWVLREACRQIKEWQERYPSDPPLMVGTNISARQLEHPDLADEVEEALRDGELDPKTLVLEITESAVVKDEEHNIDAMRRLEALGIRFALDDFGTGYSALSYLRRLPVGLLKLDRSFMDRLGEDAEAEVLLSGVIGIASGLGLYVLAEGVETPGQLALVKSLGCDLAQGYYLSKPLPSEALEELLHLERQGNHPGEAEG